MIYFIQQGTDGPIKVGTTRNVKKRWRELQTANPEDLILLGVIEGGEELEKLIHHELHEHHVRGEWFRDSPHLREWLARRPLETGLPSRLPSMSEAMRSPEVRRKVKAGLTRPEVRARISNSLKERWKDPQYRSHKRGRRLKSP